jgi:hypothetical protein
MDVWSNLDLTTVNFHEKKSNSQQTIRVEIALGIFFSKIRFKPII